MLFVGKYPAIRDHSVEDNNILVTVENFLDGESPQSDNDVFDPPDNYWDADDGPNITGGPGGSGSNVTKTVEFRPFREKSVKTAVSNV